MRPLYLDAARAQAVALDGPALCVRGAARAAARYPLRRLTRVLVRGAIEWQTRALLECLRRGIPVSFTARDGTLLGVCIGATPGTLPLYARIAEFATRCDWAQHYGIWLRAAERRAILAAARHPGLCLPDLRPQPARLAIERHIERLGFADAGREACAVLESAATTFAARMLHECGLPPCVLLDEKRGYNLVLDLGRLLAWDARVLAYELLAAANSVPSRHELASTFEAREPLQWKAAHRYLDLLEHRITDLNFGKN